MMSLHVLFLKLNHSSGWLQQFDWWGVWPLWTGCGPLVIHLISCGLQRILYLLVTAAANAFGLCGCGLSGKGHVLCWSLVVVGGVTSVSMCSGLGLLLAIIGFLLRAGGCGGSMGNVHDLREVGCVLICLQLLTTPAIVTWARSIRYV